MKKNKIYIFIMLLVCLCGCADEELLRVSEEQTYTLTLYAPDLLQVNLTRAVNDEQLVKDLWIYADDGFSQKYTVNKSSSMVLETTVKLSKTATKIWVTGNVEGSGTNPYNTVLSETVIGDASTGVLPLWGQYDISENADKNIKIKLNCSVCKVSVEAAPPDDADYDVSLDNPAYMCRTNSQGFLIPANSGTVSVPNGTAQNKNSDFNVGKENGTYFFPTSQQGATQSRLVVKSGEYYYPIEFKVKDSEEYFDLLPGHWYQVKVTKIEGNGYKDLNDALTYPCFNIETEIIDHRPEIFDMVANATDELGVSNTITLDASANENGTGDVTLETDVFTTYTPELFAQDSRYEMRVEYQEGISWLTAIKEGEPTQTNSSTGKKGYFYTYTLTATPNTSTTDRETTITFKVGLLEKKLKVIQKGLSLEDALRLNNMTVKFYTGDKTKGGVRISDDYFKSLNWRSGGHTSDVPPIYGAMLEDMQNQTSRIGLIYNMVRTKDEKDGTDGYAYFIPLKNGDIVEYSGKRLGHNDNYDLDGTICAYFYQTNRTVTDLYNQSETILIKKKKDDDTFVEIEIPVYFSGTISYLNPDNGQIVPSGDEAPKSGWYYYEYVKGEDTNSKGTFYIFDRNIGARSNGPWSDDTETGDENAKGAWFYKRFNDWKWEDPVSKYQGVIEPQHSISDNLKHLDLSGLKNPLKYTSVTYNGKRVTCPWFKLTDKPFTVYFPLIKYLEGNTWRDTWSTIDQNIVFHPTNGFKRGDGGFYWYYDDKYNTGIGDELNRDKHFWWNVTKFTTTGYTTEPFRVTPANGGRTGLYFGLQTRPVYRP